MDNKLILELLKGKQSANKLQELLVMPLGDEGLLLAEKLLQQISKSFTDSLVELNSGKTGRIGPDDGLTGDNKKVPVRYRRGCYKRKREAESWVRVTATMEDGHAWRKYGQKDILNSKYPRCYFRCTYKYDQGCKATKQVQRMDHQTSIIYKSTYFGHHTCVDTKRAPQIIRDLQDDDHDHVNYSKELADAQSELTDNKSSANSTTLSWENYIVSESFHDDVASSIKYNNNNNNNNNSDESLLAWFGFEDIDDHQQQLCRFQHGQIIN